MWETVQAENIKIKHSINRRNGIQVHLEKMDNLRKNNQNSGPR